MINYKISKSRIMHSHNQLSFYKVDKNMTPQLIEGMV